VDKGECGLEDADIAPHEAEPLAEENAAFAVHLEVAAMEKQARVSDDAGHFIGLVAASPVQRAPADVTTRGDLDELRAPGTAFVYRVRPLKRDRAVGQAFGEQYTECTLRLDRDTNELQIPH
jgi:hypothetical protein